MTRNYGLAGGVLNASVHVARMSQRGDDGMTIMDVYNRYLPRTIYYRQPGGVL